MNSESGAMNRAEDSFPLQSSQVYKGVFLHCLQKQVFSVPHFHAHQLLRCNLVYFHQDKRAGHHNEPTEQNPNQTPSSQLEPAEPDGDSPLFLQGEDAV